MQPMPIGVMVQVPGFFLQKQRKEGTVKGRFRDWLKLKMSTDRFSIELQAFVCIVD